MKPITFPAVNKTLLAPDSMPECGNLPVFTDGVDKDQFAAVKEFSNGK